MYIYIYIDICIIHYIYIYICKRNLYVLFDMAAFCIKVLIVLIVLNFQNNILNY